MLGWCGASSSFLATLPQGNEMDQSGWAGPIPPSGPGGSEDRGDVMAGFWLWKCHQKHWSVLWRRGDSQDVSVKAVPREQGQSFWSPGAQPIPNLFLLALPSSHFPFSLKENGFSSTWGGREQSWGLTPRNGIPECCYRNGRISSWKFSWTSFSTGDPPSFLLPCSLKGGRLRSQNHHSPMLVTLGMPLPAQTRF